MLVIDVELLTGRYAATAHDDRSRAEWPPHPARFFSALTAALYSADPVDARERAALLWLEAQPPPSLDVERVAAMRRVLDVYVPVNDVSLLGDVEKPVRDARRALDALHASGAAAAAIKAATKKVDAAQAKLAKTLVEQQVVDEHPKGSEVKTAAALLPDRRTRQVRTFPVATPARARFSFCWPTDPPEALRVALDGLCDRVTRLGHSSSLVRCAIIDRTFVPTLVPDVNGNLVLRTVAAGQLERLDLEFARHHGVEGRTLPSHPQMYAPPRQSKPIANLPGSVFSEEWIIFERVEGARPLSSRGTDVARAFRGALLEQCGAHDVPEWLSGHAGRDLAATRTHLAIVPLPFVGGDHADASVQGCALVPPRDLTAAHREMLARLIAKWEKDRAVDPHGSVELAAGSLPPVRFRRVDVSPKWSLQPRRWCAPSRRWVTATPIALDKNPGNLRSNRDGTAHKAIVEAQRAVADACERIGLPRPVSVEISASALVPGAQAASAFLPWPQRPGRHPRVRVHADIRFADRVNGPVLLGAGRFYGLGLCLPAGEDEP